MLSNLELAEFFNQMGMILHSGISSLEGLTILAQDSPNERDKELLLKMIETLEDTGYLYDAAASTEAFPSYALQMIKLGEETGCLDEIMTSLSRHYTREANFAGMIRSSLLYPCVMLGMMALIIVILLTKVMPVFQQVFLQLGQDMTGFSAVLLHMGENLSRHSILLVVFAAFIVIMIALGRKHLPFQKNIQMQISACRFCEGLSIALKSGITVENSLALASDLIENKDFTQKTKACTSFIEEGRGLADALHKSGILTGTYARMITLSEKTGTLDETLSQVASEYEYAINNKITRIISMLEPTLVIVLSVIVGVILFSVMLPLLGVMTGL